MELGWTGEVVRVGWGELVREGLPGARSAGEVVAAGLREARRELAFAEVAARQVVLLQDGELEERLEQIGALSRTLVRTRLRLACEVAQRGLHLGSGFSLTDWLAQRCPELAPGVVRDLSRLATASGEVVLEPLVEAVLEGAMPLDRAAAMHRALVRVRGAVSAEEYEQAVTVMVQAGSTPAFEERDITRVIQALLRACLPERDHDGRARAQRGLRDVHASDLADGSVRRIIVTFGDEADYEAVHAVLTSPLAAPASMQEQEATGVVETRTAGQRRYDALMTVLRRGVAGTKGQPTTPEATLVVTMDLDTLRRDLAGAGTGERRPGCGATLAGAPVSAATVRVLACEADIIPLVLGGPGEIVDQGRRRRLVTPGQRIRLAARDRGCTIPGCTVPATWCDAHHVIPWAHGGASDLSNYALLCPRHHTWVHDYGHTARVTPLGVTWLLRP